MERSNLLPQVQQFIRDYRLLQKGEKVIAAVSGGIDSVVMLDVLLELQESLKLEIVVAHFNHQLRGKESDEDEEFVRELCAKRNIECYVERANTAAVAESRRLSMQEAARDLRYDFFVKLLSSSGFDKIATAHNADDNAETMLFNMFRGAGVSGLAGIPVWRKDVSVVRPLLVCTRSEIETYARERRLPFRVDSSNAQSDYSRNFLRNTIIPALKENINPNLVGTLQRMGEIFAELNDYLVTEANQTFERVLLQDSPTETIVNISALHAQPEFMQEYLLLLIGRKFSQTNIEFSTVKAMVKVSHAETGASCSIGKDSVLFRDRDRLVFRHTIPVNSFSHKIELNRKYDFEYFQFSSAVVEERGKEVNGSIEYIDADRLGENLLVRSWMNGDWFRPLGMEGKKKLSDFFIDEKVPVYEKHSIPLLESDGEIVWVCGKRLDDRFKVTKRTRRILRVEYVPRRSAD